MGDVFISYSRKDKDFVHRLDESLKNRGREAWVDWEGIRPTEEFMQAIYAAIEAADTFVFVLTPESVASVVCRREIAHATAHNKRMVPVVQRDVAAETVPEALAKLNWIFSRDADDFEKAVDTLISAFDTDLEWVRGHTRLLTRAIEWEAKGKNNSFVLRGVDLQDAEQWLAQAGINKERQPTALQTEYIIASRKAAARLQRIVLGTVSVGFVVAVSLAVWAFKERNVAQERGRISRTALSGQLAVQARADLESHPQRGLLLALEALNTTGRAGEQPVPVAQEALRAALANSGGRVVGRDDKPIEAIALSSDNKWLVTASDSGVLLRSLGAGDQRAGRVSFQNGRGPVAFSPNNRWLASGSADGNVQLLDLTAVDAGAKQRSLDAKGPVAFSPDNHWLVTADRNNNALLWDLAGPNPAAVPLVLSGHTMQVNRLAVSPNGNWLVTASDESVTHTGAHDPTARLWDLTRTDPSSAPIVLRGHEGPIGAVAFSADSQRVVTAGGGSLMGLGRMDKTVRLWNVAAKDPSANAIVFSADDDFFQYASVGIDNHWLLAIGAQIDRGHPDRRNATALLWDLTANDPATTKAVLLADGLPVSVAIAALSPDRHWLATAGPESSVRLWNLAASTFPSNPRVLRGHESRIESLAFSPDGASLVAGGEDGTARQWRLTTADSIANPVTVQSTGDQRFIISPDSHWMATRAADYDVARIWDLTAADPAMAPTVLTASKNAFLNYAFSPDSRWLLSGDDKGNARLWNLTAQGAAVNPIVVPGHSSQVSAVAISPDNRWLVTGSFDGTARAWSLDANGPTGVPRVLQASAKTPDGRDGAVFATAISPDSRWLITWGQGAFLFDLTALNPVARPLALGGIDGPDSLAVSPNNRWLATVTTPRRDPQEKRALENNIRSATDPEQRRKLMDELGHFRDVMPPVARLWNLNTKDPTAEPRVLQDARSPVSISPDGHWLVTGSLGGAARIWDLTADDPTLKPSVAPGHTDAIESLVFSPDNRRLVSGSNDGTARVWNLDRPQDYADSKATPVILKGAGQPVTVLAISSDSRWLATGSFYGKWLLLWDLAAKEPAGSPIALPITGGSGHATFTRDGQGSNWLVTDSSEDKTVRLWNMRLDELRRLACDTAGRNLTQKEWQQYFYGQAYQKTCTDLP